MVENFVVGLAITLLGALLLYAFKVRQLYVVIPKLFSASSLTSNGKLVEIRTINRGRLTEEDVQIGLDNSLRYEIVASSDSSCTLNSTTISIPRVPPMDDFSVLLLVEGGEFTKERLSTISSKNTKGKILPGIEHVPPNAGTLLLGLLLFVSVIFLPVFGVEYYQSSAKARQLSKLEYLKKDGWGDLARYSQSEFRGRYSDGEFPIHLVKVLRKADIVEIEFRVVNKSAAALTVSLYSSWPHENEDPRPWEDRNIYASKVQPQDASNIMVKLYYPKGKKGDAAAKFLLDVNKETISLDRRIAVD
jgi:hypothetical protein